MNWRQSPQENNPELGRAGNTGDWGLIHVLTMRTIWQRVKSQVGLSNWGWVIRKLATGALPWKRGTRGKRPQIKTEKNSMNHVTEKCLVQCDFLKSISSHWNKRHILDFPNQVHSLQGFLKLFLLSKSEGCDSFCLYLAPTAMMVAHLGVFLAYKYYK